MKRFYELYPNAENLPQPVADSSVSNRPQAVDDSEQLVFCIPWGHNRIVFSKVLALLTLFPSPDFSIRVSIFSD